MRNFSFISSKLEIYWVKCEIPFPPQVKNELIMFTAHLFEHKITAIPRIGSRIGFLCIILKLLMETYPLFFTCT